MANNLLKHAICAPNRLMIVRWFSRGDSLHRGDYLLPNIQAGDFDLTVEAQPISAVLSDMAGSIVRTYNPYCDSPIRIAQ
jgi:hypothetical protein